MDKHLVSLNVLVSRHSSYQNYCCFHILSYTLPHYLKLEL